MADAGKRRWRLPSNEGLRRERELTRLRLIVAVAIFVQLFFVHPNGALLLAAASGLYLLVALVGFVAIHRNPPALRGMELVGHAADLSAGVALIHFGTGPSSSVVIVLALVAVAYRDGLRGALIGTGTAVVLILGAVYLLPTGSIPASATTTFLTALELCSFIAAAGVAIGYLIESGDRLRQESESIAAVMSDADARLGLKHTMAVVFDAVAGQFNARRAVLVVRDVVANRVFMWQGATLASSTAEAIRVDALDPRTFERYVVLPGAEAWSAIPQRGLSDSFDVIALNSTGALLPDPPASLPPPFLASIGSFEHLLGFTVERSGEWSARLFLIDPAIKRRERRDALVLGQRIVRRLCPAVDNASLLHRLRSRSAADERTRIARELHDGVIQSLLGIQIQLHTVAAGMDERAQPTAIELQRLGGLLRNEVLAIREMMQQMQPPELAPERLVETLSDIVQRFEYETGIRARFSSQFDRVDLSPRACRELTRVVHEALVNVRKHSGAASVFVQFICAGDVCRVSVLDDGRGFPLSGWSAANGAGQGRHIPRVIKERVRLLGGDVTVESAPNQGARVAISIPLSGPYAVTG